MPKIMLRNNNNTGERGESSKSATKEGLVTLQYPTLSRTNYSAWAMKMKVYLRAQGVVGYKLVFIIYFLLLLFFCCLFLHEKRSEIL